MPKVCFVLIKNKDVVNTESITPENAEEIERKLNKIDDEKYNKAKVVFGDGHSWDFSFPMTVEKMNIKAKRLFKTIQP